MQDQPDHLVISGRITGLYGVKGWVKIFSDTEPRENIIQYSPWYVRTTGSWKEMKVAEGRRHGKGVVARLEGFTDRDAASTLIGAEIALRRDQLPVLEHGEYYWTDLIGLRVITRDGTELGVIDRLFETGANDVVVVKGDREHLIPYLPGRVISRIDLKAGEMEVDWDPEF